MARQFRGLHTLLLNKYYVDEFYDAAIVQPIKSISEEGLWRGFDVRLIDGAVNGVASIVDGGATRAAASAVRFGAHLCRLADRRGRGDPRLLPLEIQR